MKLFVSWLLPLIEYRPLIRPAVLVSGGYDSAAVLEMLGDVSRFDFIFFKYKQRYEKEEEEAIWALEQYYGITVERVETNWGTDIRNRNFLMISRLQELGYREFYLGTRNVLPMFDKYGDSNWLVMKRYARTQRITIKMPVCMFSKRRVIKKIPVELLPLLYTTEKPGA